MTKSILRGLDPYLVLLAPDGTELLADDDGGEDNNALLYNVSLPHSGRYRIQARSYNTASNGLYTLELHLRQPGSQQP